MNGGRNGFNRRTPVCRGNSVNATAHVQSGLRVAMCVLRMQIWCFGIYPRDMILEKAKYIKGSFALDFPIGPVHWRSSDAKINGGLCTTCAPRDQEKSIDSKRGRSLFGVMQAFGRLLECPVRTCLTTRPSRCESGQSFLSKSGSQKKQAPSACASHTPMPMSRRR